MAGQAEVTWRSETDERDTAQSFLSCTGGAEVTLLTLYGVGHFPYMGYQTQVAQGGVAAFALTLRAALHSSLLMYAALQLTA